VKIELNRSDSNIMTLRMTVKEARDCGLWDRICRVHGLDPDLPDEETVDVIFTNARFPQVQVLRQQEDVCGGIEEDVVAPAMPARHAPPKQRMIEEPVWHERVLDFKDLPQAGTFFSTFNPVRERRSDVLGDGYLCAPVEMDVDRVRLVFLQRFPAEALHEFCHGLHLEFTLGMVTRVLNAPLTEGFKIWERVSRVEDREPLAAKWLDAGAGYEFHLADTLHLVSLERFQVNLVANRELRDDMPPMPIRVSLQGILYVPYF